MTQTVRDYLTLREAELLAQIVEIQSTIAPLERELVDVRKAKAAISGVAATPSIVESQGLAASNASVEYHRQIERDIASSPYQRLSMKKLVIKALTEQFENGATANQLIEFFDKGWSRKVMRTSLSPQLSRLKDEGEIERHGQVWKRRQVDVNALFAGLDDLPNENGAANGLPSTAPETALSAQ